MGFIKNADNIIMTGMPRTSSYRGAGTGTYINRIRTAGDVTLLLQAAETGGMTPDGIERLKTMVASVNHTPEVSRVLKRYCVDFRRSV